LSLGILGAHSLPQAEVLICIAVDQQFQNRAVADLGSECCRLETNMARNGISRRKHASAAASRDPVPMIDHCVAILTLALFLSMLGSITFAADRASPEQGRACTPDVLKYGESIADADHSTLCLRQRVRDLSPTCRVVVAQERAS
jgi:hypothetical protein